MLVERQQDVSTRTPAVSADFQHPHHGSPSAGRNLPSAYLGR